MTVVRRVAEFAKRDDARRLVWCELLSPGGEGSPAISAGEVRSAAFRFMLGLARGEYSVPGGVEVVESFIAREGDPDFATGAWVLAMKLAGDAWRAVSSGEVDACEVEIRLESVEPVVYTDDGSSPIQKHLPGRHDQKTHGRRAAAVRVAAVKLLDRAKEAEPQTTADLQDIVAETGGQLVGLDFRLKTQGSLERKTNTELERHKGYGVADATAVMRDVLRYTVESEDAALVKTIVNVHTALEGKGYEPMPEHFKNTWGGEGYKGVHTSWKTPDGVIFELQFHTPRSYVVKENESHPLYEKLRVAKTDAEMTALRQQISDLWRSVPAPPGIIGLTSAEAGL